MTPELETLLRNKIDKARASMQEHRDNIKRIKERLKTGNIKDHGDMLIYWDGYIQALNSLFDENI